MSEMRKRIAKVIHDFTMSGKFEIDCSWCEEELACAAIAAMREPTEAMLTDEEAQRHLDGPPANLAWWRAMIDAARR